MNETPTVYLIDDSATMREVIKIAFRRENINVVACHDAASALSEIEKQIPDVVISDVIMPDKDGYEVCQFIKQHPLLAKTPVILMSGVVNRTVAEKAFAVKADELIRKPFQPQDLITRVKHLLRMPAPAPPPVPAAASAALSTIFAASTAAVQAPGNGGAMRPPVARPSAPPPSTPNPSPLAPAFAAAAPAPAPVQPHAVAPAAPAPVQRPAAPAAPVAPAAPAARVAPAPAPAPAFGDAQKLKLEIMRLENLVKKLQSELEAERQYSRALEEHVKTLQESE